MSTRRRPVPDTSFRPWEEEILKDFKSFALITHHGGRATPRKGRWIKGYLLQLERGGRVEGDYLYNIHREWKKFCTKAKALRKLDFGNPGTYQNFKTYFWILEKSRLVERSKRPDEKASRGGTLPRHYYITVRRNQGSALWLNPYSIYK